MRTLLLLLAFCVSASAQLNVSRAAYLPLLKASAAAGDSFSGTTLYVNTDSTVGGDGTTTNTSGATRAFATLYEAIIHSSLDTALTAGPTRISCMGSINDVTNVTQTQWNSVSTTPSNYLEIKGNNPTPGIWNDTAYRMAFTNANAIYNNQPAHVRIDNLQVHIRGTTGSGYLCYRLSTANVGSGRIDADCRISRSIARMDHAGGGITGFGNSEFAIITHSNKMRMFNCLAYTMASSGGSYTMGFNSAWTNVTSYNCTSVSNGFNYIDPQILKNCISAAPTLGNGFESVTALHGSSYNSSSDASAPGSNSRTSQTYTFVGGVDFHLQSGDTGAKDFGVTDPSGVSLFGDDVDGQTRSGSWDIGFDEQQ